MKLKNYQELWLYWNILLALIYNQPRLGFDGNVKEFFKDLKHRCNKLDYVNMIKNKKNLFYPKRNAKLGAMIGLSALICGQKSWMY